MSDKSITIGQRVIVTGKDVKGTVAYLGHPTFASGKWIGIVLDEPKGKNNGTVRGHAYFRCEENYGVFVRQTQIQLLDKDDNPKEMTTSSEEPKSSASNRRLSSITVAQRSRPTTVRRKASPAQTKGTLSMSSSRTSLASSRQSLTSYVSPTAERASSPDLTKRASFVETGFVETLTPQYTPGQSLTSPQTVSTAVEDRLANMQAQQEMPVGRRCKRVSAAQWDMALDFLECHRDLVRGYNNNSRSREIARRLWKELADLLNAESSGAFKTPKDWAIYINNFKSRLKKMVSRHNTKGIYTRGRSPLADSLSEVEQRFLPILGLGFGQGVPNGGVNPFPKMESAHTKHSQDDLASVPEMRIKVEVHENLEIEENHFNDNYYDIPLGSPQPGTSGINQAGVKRSHSPPPTPPPQPPGPPPPRAANAKDTPGNDDVQLPRRTRRTPRHYTRPMAPIDEARRMLLQVERQRAAADAEHTRALHLIAQNLGRLADVAERYFGMHQNTD